VELAKELLELQGDRDPIALDVLAAAYATSGSFEKAQALSRRAAHLADQTPVAGEIRGRLHLYETRRRYVR